LEILLIDDGSTDGTTDWCREACRDDSRFHLVSFSRNFGHQAAVSAGLDYAAGDRVVVIDGDLQDPPEVIPLLLGRLQDGYDVAYGVRRRRKESLARRLAYFLFYRLLAALTPRLRIPVDAGDFCAMDRKVVDAIRSLPERHRFLRGMRAWVGFRQIGVEYERAARHWGRTKYAWRDCFALAGEAIVDFSQVPLHAILGAGIALSGIAVLLAASWVGGLWGAAGGSPNSLPTAALLLAAGLLLLGLGIVAEYLGRILLEIKGRPTYVVRETTGLAPRGRPGASPGP
jgi:dolichol-phosphate mannosyltransferase